MSDLITKLNYTKQTKNLIKQALIDQGQEITSETSFRNYAPTIEDMSVGVKLFNTLQEMNNDDNPKEGDLAVVYREDLATITEDSEFDSCTFPNTVTFTTVISSNSSAMFRSLETGSGWFDGNASLSPTGFTFDGYGDEMVRVTYTSSDGLIYTRTDGGSETINFGTAIKYDGHGDPLDPNITTFMKIGGKVFEGLYQFDAYNEDTLKVAFNNIDSVDVFLDTSTSNTPCYDIIYNENSEIINWSYIAQKEALIHDSLLKGVSYANLLYYKDVNDNDIFLVWVNGSSTSSNWTPTNGYPYFTFDINGAIKTVYSMYNSWNIVYATIDASDNVTYTFVNTPTTNTVNLASGSSYQMYNYSIPEALFVPKAIIRDSSTGVATTVNGKDIKLELVKNGIQYVDGSLRAEINKHESDYEYAPIYKLADTQLTLNNVNQLDVDVSAYGSMGVITGDGSLYQNLNASQVLNVFFGMTELDSTIKLYGKVNDSYSNITTNNKPTYLKENVNGNKIFGKVLEQKQLPYLDINGRQIYISKINGNYIARYHNGNTYTYALFDKNDNILQEINLLALCGKDDFVYYITTTNLYKVEISTGVITNLTAINILAGNYATYTMKIIKECFISINCNQSNHSQQFIYNLQTAILNTIFDFDLTAANNGQRYLILECENNIYFRFLISTTQAALSKLDLITGNVSTIATNLSTSLSFEIWPSFISAGYEENGYAYSKSFRNLSSTPSNFVILDTSNGTVSMPGYVTLNGDRMDINYRFFRSIKDNKLYLSRIIDSYSGYYYNKLALVKTITKNGNNLDVLADEIEVPISLPTLNNNNSYNFLQNRSFEIYSFNDNIIEFETHYLMYLHTKCKRYSISNINDYNVICINTSASNPEINYNTWTAIQNNSLQLGGDYGITQTQVDEANDIADNILGID